MADGSGNSQYGFARAPVRLSQERQDNLRAFLESCTGSRLGWPGVVHVAANVWMGQGATQIPGKPPSPTTRDVDVKPSVKIRAEFSDALDEAVRKGDFASKRKALDGVLELFVTREAGRPTKAVPSFKAGFRLKQADGSWHDIIPGWWMHEFLASAIRTAGHTLDAVYDQPGSGGALCCDWHKTHYKPQVHGQNLHSRNPEEPGNAAAFAAGSSELMELWAKSRSEAAKDSSREFDMDWWAERTPVPEFPIESDFTYSEARRNRMNQKWLEHDKQGPVESWDPECWAPISPEPHNGPWYVDYSEAILEEPRVQGMRGYADLRRRLDEADSH